MNRLNTRGSAVRAFYRFKFVPVFLLVLTTLLFTSTVPAAELVVNGGFEMPDIINGTPEDPASGAPAYDPSARALDQGWTTFYGQNYTDTCSASAWEQECSNGYRIPGWDIWWTDTLLEKNPGYDPDPSSPDYDPVEFFSLPASDARPGRIEIQNNWLPTWVNPLVPEMNIERAKKTPPLPPIAAIAYARFGEQKAEMDSHDRYDPNPGPDFGVLMQNHNVSLNQTLSTCPSQPYVLKYSWRSRTTVVGDNDVRVVVGGTVVRVNTLTADWVEETVRFVSGDTYATELAFISIGTGTTLGMSLDGISVTGPTPDALGNCPPPPPVCTPDDDSSDDEPLSCEAPSFDDSSSHDGSSHDGSSHDGTSHDDGEIHDGSSHDGSSHDGSSHDGSSSDGSSSSSDGSSSSSDGSSSDGSSSDGDDDSTDGVSSCGMCSEGSLGSLTLVYDGDDFTSQGQSVGMFSIDPLIPTLALPVEARIYVFDDETGEVLFSGNVRIGDAFTFEAENSLRIEIRDGGLVVQTVRFNASCSQPLEILDTFGGLTIWAASSDDGDSED